jgi:hypothetical protein
VIRRCALPIPEPIPRRGDPLRQGVVAFVGEEVPHQTLDLAVLIDGGCIEFGQAGVSVD